MTSLRIGVPQLDVNDRSAAKESTSCEGKPLNVDGPARRYGEWQDRMYGPPQYLTKEHWKCQVAIGHPCRGAKPRLPYLIL